MNRSYRLAVSFALTFAWAMSGCGGSDTSPQTSPAHCIPGESEACSCQDGSLGAQVCKVDGTFEACVCERTGEPEDMTSDAPEEMEHEEDAMDMGRDAGADMNNSMPDMHPLSPDMQSGEPDMEQEVCQPDCSGRTCGQDPVCGELCGECSGVDICTEGGKCEEAPTWLVWKVNGQTKATHTSHESSYWKDRDLGDVLLPKSGRNVMLSVLDVSQGGGFFWSCDDQNPRGYMSVLTSDNGWSKLDALPAPWKNVTFASGRDCMPIGGLKDEFKTFRFSVSESSTGVLKGDLEIEIVGAGPRRGSTLTIEGKFDAELTRR